jgi:predicted nuclease of predicted toxin-antitoxin system
MRLKLDENLPLRLVDALKALGHDVDTVEGEGLAGHPDPEVWTAAQKEKRVVVTQDLFFADVRQHPPGEHPGVVLIRMGEPGRDGVYDRVLEVFKAEDTAGWEACNVVITEVKVRVRRAQS